MNEKPFNPNHVLALLSSVVFLAVINANMVNLALPYIGRDFGVTEGTYGWIVTGYSLAFGIFNAIDGRLADVVGMKRLYMFGIVVFGVVTVGVSVSPTIELAIALRFLQGAGAAALPVMGSSIVARLYTIDERGAAMGVILSTVGVAASIGPFLGGVLVQFGGWRLCLGVSGIVLLALPVAWRLLPDSLNETVTKRFDIVGAVLLGSSVALGMYGFQLVDAAGFSRELGGCLIGSLVLAGALGWWVHRVDTPFIPPALLRNGRYIATAFIAFLSNATRFGTVVLIPILLTEVSGLSPVSIGLVLLPGAIAIAVISRRAGALADSVGPRKPVAIGTMFIVGGNIVAAVSVGQSPVGVSAGMLLYGIGFALIQSPLSAAASQLVPREMTGGGMGIFMMTFFLGGAFGTALSVTTVELQAVDAVSWLGLELGRGARYSNGILALNGLALLGVCLVRFLPKGKISAQ